MFFPSELAYREIRRRQQELLERAALAELVASARREAAQARPARPSRRDWLARRFRANPARP